MSSLLAAWCIVAPCLLVLLILCASDGDTSPVLRRTNPSKMGMFWTTIRNASAPSSPSSFLSAASSVVYRPQLIIDRASVSKVAGGTVAKNEQFPHLVSIILIFGDGSDTLCGGSIIADRYVLTAAHCLYGMQEATIIPGQTTIQIPFAPDTVTVRVKPSDTILHPGYDPVDILNDIALIRLPQPLTFSSRVQPIRLPSWTDSYTGLIGYDSIVSGWGAQSNDDYAELADEMRLELRYATNTIVSNEVCYRVYGPIIRVQQICAAGEGGRNPCQGDSGGPLSVKFDGHRLTQVGIVSYGSVLGCQNGVPGVYTRVSSYIEWIVYHTGIVT
ncbi:brachyurin-like [Anopheles marshallii]|uniref:brachyurin-like n=1 Tax=Anopheles marshallii TaxID=1521116 RepID=UPI00237A5286|nr:brachyurin-like [Anopheles marshallii]